MTTFHYPFFSAGMAAAPYAVCAPSMYYHHKPYPDAPANLVDFDAESSMLCRRRGPNRGAYCVVRSPQRDRIYSATTLTAMAATSAAAATPIFIATSAPVNLQVTVGFKYGQRQFHGAFPLQLGDLVVVEGDRGEDMGRVLDFTAVAGDVQATAKIIRHATVKDQQDYNELSKIEVNALHELRRIAAQIHFRVNIVDVMYQLDMKKITVVISREERRFVDFRRLQRAIFEIFRCRVWFSYLDEIEETKSTNVTRRPQHRDPATNNGATEKAERNGKS